MNHTLFDGQQTNERILYTIIPHPLSRYVAQVKIVFLAAFFLFVLSLIASIVPVGGEWIKGIGVVLCFFFLTAGLWWNHIAYAKDRTYITDRRIIRFDTVSPFFQTKRALFWSEALKAKAYAPNLFYRFLRIGTLEVEPVTVGEQENVIVTDVYYFEDLANYIDKILFTFKNKPTEIDQIKPFIPLPRGHRG